MRILRGERFLMRMLNLIVGLVALAAPAVASATDDGRAGGKLLLTDGVTTIDGSAGGGIATWAVIAGRETKDGIGGTATATLVTLPEFTLTSYGGAIGMFDRVELSYTHQRLDTRNVGAALGLGRGFLLSQDVLGAKVRLFGDAVWDQDRWLPQVAVGVQHRIAAQGPVLKSVGAKDDEGTDFYVSATKVVLSRSLIVNGTVRFTNANQWGLLGFGGDKGAARTPQFEGSAGVMLARNFLIGGEYRTKPDNLGFAKEDDAFDAFAAWGIHRNATLTAAYADVGDIATVRNQRGLFLSLKGGF